MRAAERGLSLRALAELAGVGPWALYRAMRGEQSVSLDRLCKIAGALGCRPDELMRDQRGAGWSPKGPRRRSRAGKLQRSPRRVSGVRRRAMEPLELRRVFASNVRSRAAKNGISAHAVAVLAGIAPPGFRLALRGRQSVTLDRLCKIAAALGCQPDELVRWPKT